MQPVANKVRKEITMSFNPNFTSPSFSANATFHTARYQAYLAQLVERPIRRFKPLVNFKNLPGILKAERTYLGLQDIPVEKIIGSVRRTGEFDHRFRPLRKHLAAGWVSLYLRVQAGEWTPVKLYKYGEDYYVEDGHHRLSVAQSLGWCCIQSEVWEIIPFQRPDPQQLPKAAPSRTPASCCEERLVRA
jgi:hypothetical protein